VRWLSISGRILAIALIGGFLIGVGFGLTPSPGPTLPYCLTYVHATNCLQPGSNVGRISLQPIPVGAILAAIWATLTTLLVRNWLYPGPDWI
jgi:hypothetical protein